MSTATKERARPKQEDVSRLRESVAHAIGVYIDADRLESAEANELVSLTKRLTKPEPFEVPPRRWFAFSRLSDKERDRWRTLVGKAAGEPGLLDRIDEDNSFRKQFLELAKRARPIERSLFEEAGAVTLSKEVVYDWLQPADPVLEIVDLGVLVLCLSQLENGRTVVRGGRVEGEGGAERVLILRGNGVSEKFNPDGLVLNLSKVFRHLAECGLLTVTESGAGAAVERRIGYGPKTRPTEPEAS